MIKIECVLVPTVDWKVIFDIFDNVYLCQKSKFFTSFNVNDMSITSAGF